MVRNSELRGIIYSKYNNEAELAEKLNWSRQALHVRLKNLTRLRCELVSELIEALDINDPDTIIRIFLPKSTKKISIPVKTNRGVKPS